MPSVAIIDETTAGHRVPASTLEFPHERITLREIIRERVYQEVQDHNRGAPGGTFRGLVQPSQLEDQLNGPRQHGARLRPPREIDWHAQFDVACAAVSRSQVIVLVGDRQVRDLDETLELGRGIEVTFLKLVPLVGG